MKWWLIDPRCTLEHLGYIPTFLSEVDPRPAKEQFDDNYRHGGGWRPFTGFKLDLETMTLSFSEDPPMLPLAVGRLRGEKIFVYPHAWVLIIQADDSWEIARMD